MLWAQGYSFEELRAGDYSLDRKNGQREIVQSAFSTALPDRFGKLEPTFGGAPATQKGAYNLE